MPQNIEFDTPEARRVWESSMKTLRENQEKLRRLGIVSLMKIHRDKVVMSMSLSSIAKAITKQITVQQGTLRVELKGKALVMTIEK